MTAATKKAPKLDGNLVTSEVFAQVFHAYLECSDEVQAAIRDMVEIVNDPEATTDEVHAALATIADALFPTHHNGALGVDLEECEACAPSDIKEMLGKMNEQESSFAGRVNVALAAKNMTQGDLASVIGVGQPAVSMMLSRKCRPQRRTIHKIAEALGLTPSELWPDVRDTE